MKKLMFTAAVAAGLAAFGIESANTVGYQEKELTLGNNDFVIQTFLPMDKTVATTKLGDIKVTDDWDPGSDVSDCGIRRGSWRYGCRLVLGR